jgi:multiple sugar transport system substrate-binding protein
MAAYQGKTWAYPWILGTRVLFVNLDLCSRAGVDENLWYPTHWGQLEVSVKQVHALGGGIYGWGSNTAEKHRLYKKFLPFFWSAGAQLFSDDGKYCLLASVKGVDALKVYLVFHKNFGYVADQRGIEDAFLNGRVGFIISGDWLLKRIAAEKPSLNFGTTLIPGSHMSMVKSRFPGKSFLGGEFLAVTKDCRDKDAALKLIRFITSPDNQLRFCKANKSANPSSKTAQHDDYFMNDLNLQTFVRQARMAEHPPVDPDWVQFETEIETAVEKALFQGVGPATALREAALNIKRIRESR